MSSNNESDDKDRQANRGAEGALWSIFAYLLSGLIVWGGIGYGLDQWLNKNFFTLIGLLLGMGAALYLVWLRFGRK
jgi:ATP synthase protein I